MHLALISYNLKTNDRNGARGPPSVQSQELWMRFTSGNARNAEARCYVHPTPLARALPRAPPFLPAETCGAERAVSARVEVGNSIWSVKANERCAGVLRYNGSPNTSQYAVLRAECGKLVSMHQIGAARIAWVLVVACNPPSLSARRTDAVGFLSPSRDPHGLRRAYRAVRLHCVRYFPICVPARRTDYT